MTLKAHLYICLTSSVLSFVFLALALVVEFNAEHSMFTWLLSSALVFSIGAARAWWRPEQLSTMGEYSSTEIGNSDFERFIAAATVMTPPMLAAYAALSTYIFHAAMDDVGWVLIVLACNSGFKIANIIESK